MGEGNEQFSVLPEFLPNSQVHSFPQLCSTKEPSFPHERSPVGREETRRLTKGPGHNGTCFVTALSPLYNFLHYLGAQTCRVSKYWLS